jgi:X-X-X-Leu-X-X-Gly heptad repeat protein
VVIKESSMQQTAKRISPTKSRVVRASRKAQRGASLLEAIAYLGIAAIVVIGAVALLNGAFSSAGTNELAEQVNAIQTGTKKLYMGQATGYTGVGNAVLASAGVFPSTIPVDPASGVAQDNWGGQVTVASTATGTFTITYAAIPQSVCVNAVTASGSWTSITVNGANVTLPATPAGAQTACTTATNTIVWTSV